MVVALAKTGDEVHMRQLLDGVVYLNPLKYFRELEQDAGRGDPLEGLMRQTLPGGKAMVQISTVQIRDFVSVRIWDPVRDNLNVFCLHGLRGHEREELQGRNLGPYAVIIHDPQEWCRRAIRAARVFGQEPTLRACRYYDAAKLSRRVGVFDKEKRFRWQNEYRLVLSPGFGMPIVLPVGPLRDIASLHPL